MQLLPDDRRLADPARKPAASMDPVRDNEQGAYRNATG